ncbi:LysM peptidoglycan-binding domain-containing protein, partial [Pseudomonas sp. SIMBA_041]|uniref:LysM peptidoglycan-binding domain-containing protein n=1 Tax=Pseudomonas sp. SIMBA_041 TaxID=3085782 RepID=UPI0039787CD6
KRYNIGLSDLASANKLNTNSNLILGRTITIPASGSMASASSSSQSSSSASSSSSSSASSGTKLGNTESYKVKSGDGLIALA